MTTLFTHTWYRAQITDVDDIVNMAQQHFQREIDTVFTPDPKAYARNLVYAVVNQSYQPETELLTVCRSSQGTLMAYNWARAMDRAFWSDDLMVNVRMVHVDLNLNTRLRLHLINEMMQQWEFLARISGNPIICSTTMRHDQAAFLRLHLRQGYSVRGSYAYKRISVESTATSKDDAQSPGHDPVHSC